MYFNKEEWWRSTQLKLWWKIFFNVFTLPLKWDLNKSLSWIVFISIRSSNLPTQISNIFTVYLECVWFKWIHCCYIFYLVLVCWIICHLPHGEKRKNEVNKLTILVKFWSKRQQHECHFKKKMQTLIKQSGTFMFHWLTQTDSMHYSWEENMCLLAVCYLQFISIFKMNRTEYLLFFTATHIKKCSGILGADFCLILLVFMDLFINQSGEMVKIPV